MPESEELKVLKEILKWIKFSGMKNVKEVLIENLTDDTKLLIYHHSNGINSIPILKKLIGIGGNNVIPLLWNKWKNVGIIEKVSASGGERGKKIFNLEDFGILIPEVKQLETKEQNPLKESRDEQAREDKNEINGENSEDGKEL